MDDSMRSESSESSELTGPVETPVPGGEVVRETEVHEREETVREERRADEEADGQTRYEGGDIPPAPEAPEDAAPEPPPSSEQE